MLYLALATAKQDKASNLNVFGMKPVELQLQKVQAQVRSMAQSYNGSESYAMRIASMSWKAH